MIKKQIIDKEKYGHWEVSNHFNKDEWLGFIYRITNLKNNMQYIGQKKLWASIRRKPLKGTKRVRRCIKESKWKIYTGSSNHLNDDILNMGIENFKFEILSLHKNKWDMNYDELKTIVLEDAIPNQQYYNGFLGKIGSCPKSSKFNKPA